MKARDLFYFVMSAVGAGLFFYFKPFQSNLINYSFAALFIVVFIVFLYIIFNLEFKKK